MTATLLPVAGPGGAPLALQPQRDAGQHPAAVYLARLAPGSRRTMRQALDVVAALNASTTVAQHG